MQETAHLAYAPDEFLPAAMNGGATARIAQWHPTAPQAMHSPTSAQRQRKRVEQKFRLALLLTDAVMVSLAFGLAYWLRFEAGIALVPEVQPELGQYVRLVALLTPLWLFLFWFLHLYDLHYLLGGTAEYAKALNACTSGMMAVVLVSFLVPNFQIARAWLVLSWGLSAMLVCIGRLLLRRAAYHLRRQGLFTARALIVGTNGEAVALAQQLSNRLASGVEIVGFVDAQDGPLSSTQAVSVIKGSPVLGDLPSLSELVQAHDIEEVIVAPTAVAREQLIQLPERLATLPHVQMRLSSGLYEIFTTGMRVSTRNSVPLMSINRVRLDRLETIFKALLDYSLVFLMLPIALPLFAVIALLIKLDSPGPVIYRRRVVGVGGREFDAFKFRTMLVNGDEILAQRPDLMAELQAHHKLKDDPRVTPLGRFLRRTSLDELPQLINVLLGDMSLVGPRMISPDERAEYGRMQHNLFTVKPGLTGLWQVSGRSDLSYEERVQLDMHYIRNYSIWMDLQILFFQTLPAVLRRTGAY